LKGGTVLKMLVSLTMGIAIGAGVTSALMPTTTSMQNPSGISTACPTESAQAINSLAHLKQENTALLASLKNAQAVRNPDVVSVPAPALETGVAPDCTADINKAIFAVYEAEKIRAELRNATTLQEYDANLHNQFDKEEPDELWRKDIEHKFYDALHSHPERQAIVISSLDCRSTTCKVNIPVADQSTKNHFMELLSDPSFSQALGFKSATIRSAMEITGGEMTFYIANNQ
jgi:hypothetical protein